MTAGHLPDVRFIALESGVRVSNIEHIPELRGLYSIIDQRDAFRSAVDPAIHLLVPDIQRRAGHGIGTLRID